MRLRHANAPAAGQRCSALALAAITCAAVLGACAPPGPRSPGPGLADGLEVEVRNDYRDPVTVYAMPGRVRLGQVPAWRTRAFTIPPASVGDNTRIMVCQGGTLTPASLCATTPNVLLPDLYGRESVWVYESTSLFVALGPGTRL